MMRMVARLKKFGPYVAILFGVIVIPYVLITTPSMSESRRRFGVMEGDLHKMFNNGGRILDRQDVNKYGVASLSVQVSGELLNDKELMGLGWASISSSGGEYCKDGIILTTFISPQLSMGKKILNVNFRYTSQTVDICEKHLMAGSAAR
jgi:hypothetical protein